MAAVPTNIDLKTIDPESRDTDIFSIVFKFNKNTTETTRITNEILDYLRNYTPPASEVSTENIISVINSMKKTRQIYHEMSNSETRNYTDGETITRTDNMFIISHPTNTANTLYKITQLDGIIVDAKIKMENNQIIIDFEYPIDEDLVLYLF